MMFLFRNKTINDLTKQWFEGGFKKVVLQIEGEENLLDLSRKAKAAGIESHLVYDSGKTEFHGLTTMTCCAIGPDYSDKIDSITGKLKLY